MLSLPLPQAQLQASVSGIMAAIQDFHTIFKLLGCGPLSREAKRPLPQAAVGHLQAVVSKSVMATSSKKPAWDWCLKIEEGFLHFCVLINHCICFLIPFSFRYFHVLPITAKCKVPRFVVDSAL